VGNPGLLWPRALLFCNTHLNRTLVATFFLNLNSRTTAGPCNPDLLQQRALFFVCIYFEQHPSCDRGFFIIYFE
jgi:hypothetical protein